MQNLWNWIVANPAQAIGLAMVLLSVINAALPAQVAAGPVGRALHVILDRLALLTRSTAPGTLKWPLVASVVVTGADPRAGQSGSADVATLAFLGAVGALLLSGAVIVGCPRPTPPSDGGEPD